MTTWLQTKKIITNFQRGTTCPGNSRGCEVEAVKFRTFQFFTVFLYKNGFFWTSNFENRQLCSSLRHRKVMSSDLFLGAQKRGSTSKVCHAFLKITIFILLMYLLGVWYSFSETAGPAQGLNLWGGDRIIGWIFGVLNSNYHNLLGWWPNYWGGGRHPCHPRSAGPEL